jgi:fermentation-respiration switch protein FrsA (DUF1100 family)
MRFTSETISDGVTERLFTLDGITGVLWCPAGAAGGRPLILLGHGGGQHSRAPGVAARARRYVTGCGFAAAAMDAPGHGGRPRTEQDERFTADIRERMAAGQPVGPDIARHNAALAARAVPEWQARVTIPVEFLLQWDDELVPRESGLALFDAFASAEKTLHANPGRHAEVPRFEIESSVRFFGRHLDRGSGAR